MVFGSSGGPKASRRRQHGYATAASAARVSEPNALRRFPHLDVAVMDGVVYTTTRGLSALGPLATACAMSRWLPPAIEQPYPEELSWAGVGKPLAGRTAVAIVIGLCSHRLVIDHNATALTAQQVQQQVAEFNELACAARS